MEKLESIGQKVTESMIEDFRAADMATWLGPDGDERARKIKAPLNELRAEGPVLSHKAMIALSRTCSQSFFELPTGKWQCEEEIMMGCQR